MSRMAVSTTRGQPDAVDFFIGAFFDEEPVARRPTSIFFSVSSMIILRPSRVHEVGSDLGYFH